jgi:hypothetical protein
MVEAVSILGLHVLFDLRVEGVICKTFKLIFKTLTRQFSSLFLSQIYLKEE